MLAFFDLTVIVRFVTIAGLSYHACDLQQGFPAFFVLWTVELQKHK